MKPFLRSILEFALVIIVGAAIVLPIRMYVMQPFFVKGASMEPNFEDGQYLIIDEISYRFNNPQRGDVIVFKYPLDPSQYYIKRLIGLPGETVEVNGGRVKIYNAEHPLGFVLDESKYLASSVTTTGESKETLGSDQYFVMGDNRAASYDSRRWGPLSRDEVIGRVWLRAWPPKTAQVFEATQYSY